MKTSMSGLQGRWEDEYAISFDEVDTKDEVFLPVLWSLMQETAWRHANHLKVGYSDLVAHQHFWVLSRLSIQVEEYPGWKEKIKVRTWLTGTGRLFALRSFSITNAKDEIIGTAQSAWLILDLKTRKPQRIEPIFKHIRHLLDPLPSAEEPEKLPKAVHSGNVNVFKVRYTDIDMHHHVNNTKYIEWILNSYSFETHQRSHIHTFEINFLAESSPEDEISIHTESIGGSGECRHSLFRKGDGRELCRARIVWRRLE